MIEESVGDVLRGLDLLGVFANAVLGGVIGRSAKLDPVGTATLGVLSGLGGGIIRDVLLQRGTPIALTDYAYVSTALVGVLLVYLVTIEGPVWNRSWPFIDALALGCWAAAGAQKTLASGLGWLPAIILGTITAVGGGFVRDIVLRRVPAILGGNTLYATCAMVASGVLVALSALGQPIWGSIAATATGAGLCLIARWRTWVLPQDDEWSALRAARRRFSRKVAIARGQTRRDGDTGEQNIRLGEPD